ncbi:MAG: putative signal transducing protein, partial [Aeromonas veronii]
MDNWINLYRASHTLEAHALKGALEAEGVLVRLNGEGLS